MLYFFVENLNPVALALIYMPLFAFLIGVICSFLFRKKYLGSVISFFLPLLYTTSNWQTFTANIDAWMMFGSLYAIVAFLGSLLKKGSKA